MVCVDELVTQSYDPSPRDLRMPTADVLADSGHGFTDHDQVVPQSYVGMGIIEVELCDLVDRRVRILHDIVQDGRLQERLPVTGPCQD